MSEWDSRLSFFLSGFSSTRLDSTRFDTWIVGDGVSEWCGVEGGRDGWMEENGNGEMFGLRSAS